MPAVTVETDFEDVSTAPEEGVVLEDLYQEAPTDEDTEPPKPMPKGSPRPGNGVGAPLQPAQAATSEDAGGDAAAAQAATDAPADVKEWRRLAYEQRRLERENRVMADRFNRLLAVVTTPPQQQQETEPEIPDPEDNFVEYTAKTLEGIKKEITTDRQRRAYEQQANATVAVANQARNAAIQYRNSMPDPNIYDAAVAYLTQVTFDDYADDNPNRTEQELAAELADQAQRMMTGWYLSGRNPGEALIQKAVRRGFRVGSPQQQPAAASKQQPDAAAAKKKTAADPRQQVRDEQTRQSKAKTISAVQGGGAGSSLNLKQLLSLDEDEYERQLTQLAKAQGRSKIPLSELLSRSGVPNNQR